MEKIDKKLIAILVFVSLVVFTNTAVSAFWGGSAEAEKDNTQQEEAAQMVSNSLPLSISIPAIGLEAKVQPVGLGKTGNMAVLDNFRDVAWYKYGTIPGAKGSAVIAGHVNNGVGLGGVFNELDKLKVGDKVIYKAQDGTQLIFIVEETKVYYTAEAPTELIFNRADSSRLNLITCDGDWSEEAKSYDRRLVIFTKLASPINQ